MVSSEFSLFRIQETIVFFILFFLRPRSSTTTIFPIHNFVNIHSHRKNWKRIHFRMSLHYILLCGASDLSSDAVYSSIVCVLVLRKTVFFFYFFLWKGKYTNTHTSTHTMKLQAQWEHFPKKNKVFLSFLLFCCLFCIFSRPQIENGKTFVCCLFCASKEKLLREKVALHWDCRKGGNCED